MPPKPSEKRMQHFREMLAYDQAHLGFGASLAGMDEVGRGPLVGDVVTACVILPAEPVFPWVDDSKKLSATRREEVYAQIMEHALYVGIGRASAREIDEMNILNATRLAMERAAQDASATLCIVDAVRAASIVAKVTRDRQMAEYAKQYPQYGFDHNMGYGTAEHIDALRRFGPTPEHRHSFIRKFLEEGKE